MTRIALLSATAIGLLLSTGAASAAGGNKAYLTQDGSSNSASITQNSAATIGNQAGTSSDNVKQKGFDNVLTIQQNGNGGEIGVATGTTSYFNPDHPGPSNPQYTISHSGVDQDSTSGASNTANLSQTGDNSVIGTIDQKAYGTAEGNALTTSQNGANRINFIWQYQDSGASSTNIANLTETGTGNQIDRVDQRARGAAGQNSITVNISGNNNGVDDFTNTAPFYTSRGWDAGGTPSALIQGNKGGGPFGSAYSGPIGGNVINLSIPGDDNQFGMTQKGIGNTASSVTLEGDGNSFGSYQAGIGNTINTVSIQGISTRLASIRTERQTQRP